MLRLEGISKIFPGVQALSEICFEVGRWRFTALVGENGAGKSTLIKIVAGAFAPDRGEVVFDGALVRWPSPREAEQRGVQVVYQEFVLFPQLSVAENIFIGHEPGAVRSALWITRGCGGSGATAGAAWRLARSRCQRGLALGRGPADGRNRPGNRAPGEVTGARRADRSHRRARGHASVRSPATVAGQGVSVIFISHRLEEVFALCDRVTVLKDGELVGTRDVADVTRERLISMMVGRELGASFPAEAGCRTGARRTCLRTEWLSIADRVAMSRSN